MKRYSAAAIAALFGIILLSGAARAATKVFTGSDVGNVTGQAVTGYYGQRKLVRDADGYWYAVVGLWNGTTSRWEVVMKKSSDTAGSGWSSKTVLCGSGGIVYNSTSFNFRFPSIDIDRTNGKIHLVFQQENDILLYSKLVSLSSWTSSANWKNVQETATGYQQLVSATDCFYEASNLPRYGHGIALDSSGNPHIAYSRKPTSGSEIYKPYYLYGSTSGGWNSELNLNSADTDQRFPTIEVDSSGRVHYLVQYGTRTIHSYYSDNYTSFTGPSTLFNSASYDLFGITMAADGNGKVHAATRENMTAPDTDIWTAFYDGSSWTATQDMDTRNTGWIDLGARQGIGITNHVLLGTYQIAQSSYPQRLYSWTWTGSAWGQPETDTGLDQDYGHSMEKNAPAGTTDFGYLWFDDSCEGSNDCVWFERLTSLSRPPLLAYTESISSTDDIIRYRSLNGANWGVEWSAYDTDDTGVLKWHTAATNARGTRQAVLAVGSGSNTLYAALYDASGWSTHNLGALPTSDYRCFAAAYEQVSGRLVVVAATSTTNQIKYWVHDGDSWVVNGSTYSSTLNMYSSFIVLRMDAQPGSNQIGLIGKSSSNHAGALIWSGSAWGSDKQLSAASPYPNNNSINVDVKYMRAGDYAGQALFVWQGSSTLLSWTWSGSAWAAARQEKTSAAGNTILWLELAADPNSSKLLAALGDESEDLFTVDWSGTGWGTSRTVTTDLFSTVWYGRRYALAFESGSGHEGHALIVYSDSTHIRYRHTSDITGAWGSETTLVSSKKANWLELARDAQQAVHFVYQEETASVPNALVAYSWDNSAWTSQGTLEADLQSDSNGTYEAFAITACSERIGLTQAHYRWRNDDGSESAATFAVTEDKKMGLAKQTTKRLRFLVANSGALTPAALQLQAAETATCSSGTYTAVGGGSGAGAHFAMAASSYLTDGGLTSNVASGLTDPGGSSFVGGQVKESGSTTGTLNIGTNEFVEVEFSIQATAGATSSGDYCFRLFDAAQQSALGAYTNYGQAQVLGVTAVRLVSLEAKGEGAAVRVSWQTAQEVKNKGFNLYRADSPYGEYVRLNAGLIPSASISGEGRSYGYLDTGAVRGRLYYYKLEDVDAGGTHTPRGPVCVDWDADGVPDDWEIANGLDPTRNDADEDPDGDGVVNGLEYRRGTDPRSRDSDGDGIPDGDERKGEGARGAGGGPGALRGVEVIYSDAGGMTLELSTPAFDATVVTEAGQAFERLRVAAYVHGYAGAPGHPQLPVKGLLFDLPEGKRARLTVVAVESRSRSGYRPYPAPLHEAAGEELLEVFTLDEPAYGRPGFAPAPAAELSIAYLFGGAVKQRLVFYPFSFDAAAGALLHRQRIRVRFDFVADGAGSSARTTSARGRRAALSAAAAGGWVPAAGLAAYKIATDAEGIHRIPRDWLTAQGLGPTEIDAIDLSQVRLFHLGAEQAIEVYDANGNNRLDAGDHIGFYATPVPEAYRKYAKRNLYWLIAGGGAGALRMAEVPGAPTGGPLAASHESTVRHELDQLYLQSAPGADALDRWIFASIAVGAGFADPQAGLPKHFTFSLPGALGTGDLTLRLYSPYALDHTATVSINAAAAGSAAWSGIGFGEAVFSGVGFAAGANTVSILCAGATDKIGVDWIQARYARGFAAAADSIKFSHPGGFRYELTGFTSAEIALYDITAPAAVGRVTGGTVSGSGPFSMEAEPAAASSGTRTYLAVAAGGIPTPAAAVKDRASSLSEAANGADWILITSRALGWEEAGNRRGWVDGLVALRQGQGLRCAVVDVTDVFDEFGYGFAAPPALREFLAYADQNWQQPAPRHVLLVGDGTYDYKNNWNLAPAPVNHVPAWLIATIHLGETATDERYVQFDAEGGLARMAIGRLPAADLAQAEAMAAKIVAYESGANTKSWQRRVVLAADNQIEEWEAVFEAMGEDAAALLPAGIDTPQRFYLAEYENEQLAVADLTADLLAAVNAGALIVHYSGHASLNILAGERIIDNRGGAFRADVDTLSNRGMYPLVVNMACLSGYFIYPFAGPLYQSLAEGLLRAPEAGAVAALMPTAMTATDGQHLLSSALFEAIFAEDRRTIGEALAAARQQLLANGGASYQETADTFMLFGDPATVLRVPLPRRPAGLAAAQSGQAAALSWLAARDADGAPVTGYHLYRRAGTEPGFTRLTASPVSGLAYTDTGLAPGTTYTYTVSSVDADGDESVPAATASIAIPAPVAPSEPGKDPAARPGAPAGGGGGCFVSTAGQTGGGSPIGWPLLAAACGLFAAARRVRARSGTEGGPTY
jgi:hypothetical protein